jgi:hypothetical protein
MTTSRGIGNRRVPAAIAAVCLPWVLAVGTPAYAASREASAQAANPQSSPTARNLGLLPPAIIVFEQEAGPGAAPSPSVEGSSVAAETVSAAFVAEMTARKVELTVIGRDEIDAADLSRLHAVPGRLARGDMQPLPEAMLSVDYPPGSVERIMERHGLDAVWIVTGIVILTREGAGTSGPAIGNRLLLRAALVDGQRTILFSDVADENAVAPDRGAPGAPVAIEAAQVDLRDPNVARKGVEALLAEYRTEGERLEAEQAVAATLQVKAAAPRSPHRPDFRLGLGVFFVAGSDLWIGFLPRNSRWQFGYRYVSWTDNFNDPYTNNELTETTETMQGPQVNYLFRPEKRGSWYVGSSVMQWSKTEAANLNGVSDSVEVVAPFIGGGYTRHLGKHGYYNAAMFLAPWAELNTDTGVSSEQSSGGFDIQLQIGASF